MSKTDKSLLPKNQLAEKSELDSAVASYLDNLLSEISEPEALVTTKVDIATADSLEQEPSGKPLADAQAGLPPSPRVPAWAEEEFQVLLVRLDEVNLGIPLACLTGILDRDRALSVLPGQPEWQLGVLINRDDKIVVLDTAKIIMPERPLDNQAKPVPSTGKLLRIGAGDCALAVDEILSTLLLEKDKVRWRQDSMADKRPWYAGIMIEQLAVLLDTDGILSLLAA
jgi:purine-binding chemotaxis protein CheW